jgi:hypothetical protein
VKKAREYKHRIKARGETPRHKSSMFMHRAASNTQLHSGLMVAVVGIT